MDTLYSAGNTREDNFYSIIRWDLHLEISVIMRCCSAVNKVQYLKPSSTDPIQNVPKSFQKKEKLYIHPFLGVSFHFYALITLAAYVSTIKSFYFG